MVYCEQFQTTKSRGRGRVGMWHSSCHTFALQPSKVVWCTEYACIFQWVITQAWLLWMWSMNLVIRMSQSNPRCKVLEYTWVTETDLMATAWLNLCNQIRVSWSRQVWLRFKLASWMHRIDMAITNTIKSFEYSNEWDHVFCIGATKLLCNS